MARDKLTAITPPEPDDEGPKVNSIKHALDVLHYLSTTGVPEGVTGIARALGLSTSSCFNIVKTLSAEGYLDFDPHTKAYTLGWAPVVLARRALDPDGVLALLMPAMEDLADRYNVVCSVGRVTRNERVMLVGFTQSESATRIQLRVGHRVPVLAGASGRCIAAVRNLSTAEIQRHFNGLRWQEAPTIEEYLADVEFARINGWAVDDGRGHKGVASASAPVLDHSGVVRYVVSATMFSGQYSAESRARIGADLVSLASHASVRLFGPDEIRQPVRRSKQNATVKPLVGMGVADPKAEGERGGKAKQRRVPAS